MTNNKIGLVAVTSGGVSVTKFLSFTKGRLVSWSYTAQDSVFCIKIKL